jgi:hypothetical protein
MAWSATTGDLILSIMEPASEHSLYHDESVTTGQTTWTHDGTVREIIILGMSLNFLQAIVLDDVGTDDKTVPLQQIPDTTYSNN